MSEHESYLDPELEEIEQLLKYHSAFKRVKTPTVIQMESTECGAASLSILLSYYGCYLPLEEIRYRCGVTRDGANAYNMITAAKYYHLDIHDYPASLRDLAMVKPPFIIFWKHEHFLVVEGFTKEQVCLNDPATGPRQVSYPDFFKHYSGYVFEAEPMEGFKKQGKPPGFWNLIRERVAVVNGTTYLFLLSTQLILLILALIPTTLTRVFVDELISQRLYYWQNLFLFFMGLIVVLQVVTIVIRETATNRLTKTLVTIFNVDFLDHLFKLPYLFFALRSGSEVVNRVNLNQSISDFITNHLSILVINLFLISIYGIVMFQYDAQIALIGIGAGLSNALVFFLFSRARTNAYNRMQKEVGKSNYIAIDALRNLEFIKCIGSEFFYFARIMGAKIRNISNSQSIYLKDIWLTSISGLISQLALTLLITVGAWHMMAGSLSMGMLLALQMILTGFLAPFNQIVNASMKIQNLKVDMMRINDILKNPTDRMDYRPEDPSLPTHLKGKLEFRNVTFGYNPLDTPMFEELSFKIEPGQKVAFVGKSGAGKSTLLRLLCGLLPPWQGEILYDDQPIHSYTRMQITNSVAWVDQDILIFGGTIRDNLTLWDHEITDKQIEQALKKACMNEVVNQRGLGFDTPLAEEGANLSFGERQRLEIARALLLHPVILMLDEATSALDNQTEREIFRHINASHCTCIMIAHRLSTVQQCDRIYVIDQGRIVQQGTPHELQSISGIYQEMLKYDED